MREVVLIAASGGHLEQLKLLSERLPFDGERRWITFDLPQTRSLLAGERVSYVPYVAPRDIRGLLRNLPLGTLVGDASTTEAVVSTGAGMALAYLPRAAMSGIPTFYIESATRVTGPSMTGHLLSLVPKIQLHTQYQGWAGRRWTYAGSVFEGFETYDDREFTGSEIRKVVVSLGTIRGFGFRRLVERVYELLDPDVDVTWQTGATDVTGLPIRPENQLPRHELLRRIHEADVIVAHAGTGIALTALNAGLCPVLVPRQAAHNEHVDDHQAQIAKMLDQEGLAVVRCVEELGLDDLRRARTTRVKPGNSHRRLTLSGLPERPAAETVA